LSGFLGGGSQGAIRWGAGLDTTNFDQGINKVKTGMNSLASPTQQLNANLTKQNTLLGQTATQTKTLGTSVRDMGSRFGSFAVGISATTTSVLALGAGFRDYNDAQIAVDRQTRRVSLAQEALVKANDKLQKLQDKGITSGKAYAQAQLDVAQANSFLKTQTELLGERQETLFDTQSRFVATLAPAIIGTVGSMTMAFKDLGLNFGKLKGAFTSVGGIIGNFVGSLTGVGAAGVTAGAGSTVAATGIKGIDVSAKSAAFSVKGLVGALGLIAIPVAGLLLGKEALDVNADAAARLGVETKSLTQRMLEGDKQFGKSKAEVEDYGKEVDKFRSGPIGGMLAVVGDLIMSIPGVSDAVKGLAVATGSGVVPTKQLSDFEKELAINAAEVARVMGPMAGIIAKVGEETAMAIGPAEQWVKQLIEEKMKNVEALKSLHDLAAAHGVTLSPAIRGSVEDIKAYLKVALGYTELQFKATASVGTFAKAQVSAGVAITTATSVLEDAKTKLQDFNTETNKSIQVNALHKASLLAFVDANMKLPPSINLTTSELEAMTVSIKQAELGLEGGADAAKILSDAFNKQLAPALATFQGAIGADKFKDFKKALKDLPGFSDFGKGAKKELTNILKDMRDVGKVAKEVGTDISAGLLGAFEGMSEKGLGKVIKELTKDITEMSKIDIDARQFAGITDFLDKAPNKAEAFKQIPISLGMMQDAMADNVVTSQEAEAVMAKFNEETGKTPAVVNKSSAAFQVFGTSSASARGEIDAVTGSIDVMKSHFAETIPVVTINVDQPLDMIGEIKRGWDKVAGQVEKKIPKIKANADQALDMIGETKRGWDRAAGQIEKKVPKLKINADQALDMIGEVTRGLQKIKDKTVTVTVRQSGSASAQEGMHETLSQDTMIAAHKGERVDIGRGGLSNNSSGGFGGNMIVEIHEHRDTMTDIRRYKAQMGKNRYRFGF
jgi:hypothetical protein